MMKKTNILIGRKRKTEFNFTLSIYPVKNQMMHTLRTYPTYVIMAIIMMVQIPVAISGFASGKPFSVSKIVPHEKNSNSVPSNNNNLSEVEQLYSNLKLKELGLSEAAFELAFSGYHQLLQQGLIRRKGILTIADFSLASVKERLFVIDLTNEKVLTKSLVAHGKNSGLHYAKNFSNVPESNKSSLGFYLTADTYEGNHGYSMRLKGLEKNINDNAYDRAIVMHGADYVSHQFASAHGYIGRSLGCPAIPSNQKNKIINQIKDGTVLFIYYPDSDYQKKSNILNP